MEQYYPVILFLVIATGYIISIKKITAHSTKVAVIFYEIFLGLTVYQQVALFPFIL